MKEISVSQIRDVVADLAMKANYFIGEDIRQAFKEGKKNETEMLPKNILDILLQNAEIAEREMIPICQDTGMCVVFLELGQDVHIIGGHLYDAVNEGVKKAYEEGYLRKSVVRDPLRRINTNDNTPAIIHTSIIPGDKLSITVSPKGFGSENMSRLIMLKPSEGLEGIENFIVETVKLAGPNPCPPIIVGVGIGGTMEQSAILSKRALLRDVNTKNNDLFWDEIEQDLLKKINKLHIGPAGLKGNTTCLGVHIIPFPTHIAGLPVAVNIGCHVTRHKSAII